MINAYTGIVYSEAVTGNLYSQHLAQSDPNMHYSLEVNVLAGEVSVDGGEGVELVFKQVLVFGVEEAECQYGPRYNSKTKRHTLG